VVRMEIACRDGRILVVSHSLNEVQLDALPGHPRQRRWRRPCPTRPGRPRSLTSWSQTVASRSVAVVMTSRAGR
jgi:hypothetical protein